MNWLPANTNLFKLTENLGFYCLNCRKPKHFPRDYIIDVKMHNTGSICKFWRRIRVGSSIPLDLFQDKVLSPCLGWERNYHSYLFTDSRDGAQFGPVNSTAVDHMHIGLHGYVCLDDSLYTLDDLLLMPQNKLYFIYDLGDHFEYTITLNSIKSPVDSLGGCEVIDGFMGLIPEDSVGFPNNEKGNHGYQLMLEQYTNGNKKASKKCLGAVNTFHLSQYDPFEFDVQECNLALKKALNSPNSLPYGAKQLIRPTGRYKCPNTVQSRRLGGKTKEVLTPFADGYIREICAYGDNSHTLCANCGSPNKLKCCGQCRAVWYCGMVITFNKNCQKCHWSTHKMPCLKQAQRREMLIKKMNEIDKSLECSS